MKQSAEKETLMHALEKASNNPRLDMTQAQKPIAYLIDAMAMVQSTAKDSMNTVKSFGELADLLCNRQLQLMVHQEWTGSVTSTKSAV